jgi:hypothetical protein
MHFDRLSLSGWGIDFKGLSPLTLSSSKGVFAFVDSPVRRGDKRWALACRTIKPAGAGFYLSMSGFGLLNTSSNFRNAVLT